ncbi:sec-independent protein translocase protein TatA [Lishizhenia tianjinensis]|uniref:Sec-independent protein translocase protein TatA n=1 Tax=Lishizhenia tianjinensis TaxID=477690 RepID=A0A1I7BUS6_9FLAO|nr:twin-arginine translocase TatA/TatE family subunit [Lishizhenia tianjinensis]SFT90861.1 sec-independent protein translocase protein TatA [Lishizhenia tianjinensis]
MLMFLSGVAGSEIFVILLFVLIFFGANSIPGLARTLGRGFRQIKDASQEIQDEISKSTQNMKKDLNLEGRARNLQDSIQRPLDQMAQDIEEGLEGGVVHRKPPRQYVAPQAPQKQEETKPMDQDTTTNSENKNTPEA